MEIKYKKKSAKVYDAYYRGEHIAIVTRSGAYWNAAHADGGRSRFSGYDYKTRDGAVWGLSPSALMVHGLGSGSWNRTTID